MSHYLYRSADGEQHDPERCPTPNDARQGDVWMCDCGAIRTATGNGWTWKIDDNTPDKRIARLQLHASQAPPVAEALPGSPDMFYTGEAGVREGRKVWKQGPRLDMSRVPFNERGTAAGGIITPDPKTAVDS